MSSETEDLRPGRGRMPRAWRYVLALGGLLALIALFYGEENWRGRRAWERYKQELVKRGEPVEASALVPPPVPADQNFAMTPFLDPLFDFEPGTQHWQDTNRLALVQNFPAEFNAAASEVKSPKVPRSNSWVTAQIDLRAWEAALRKHTKTSATDTEVVSNNLGARDAAVGVLHALAQYDPVIEELRSASRRPYSRFNLKYDNEDPAAVLLPHLAALKRTCLLLQLRASAELAAGRTDLAFDDLNLMFYLADSTQNEPILISHLVRMAEVQLALRPLAEGLASNNWSEAQLAALEERLNRFDFCAGGRFALEGERVLFGGGIIDYVRLAKSRYRVLSSLGVATGNDPQPAFDLRPALLGAVPDGWFYLEKLNYNRLFEDDFLMAIDVAGRRVSPEACRQAAARLERLTANRGPSLVLHHRFFIAWLAPAVSKAVQKTAYAQSAVDSAMLACALERYRLAHGQYPESLNSLAPGFVAKLPHDVINGQPLKYRRTEDGRYLIYSVGWNGTDDGGVLALNKSGEGLDAENGDWVWRLP